METILRLVALVGAVAHVYFFYKETIQWDVYFVRKAAPSWVEMDTSLGDAEAHVAWAKNLALNMGVYNLILAIGLVWLAIAGDDGSPPNVAP